MTSVFKIEVRESKEELRKLLRTQTQASKRDRLRALYLHRTGQAKNRRQMAAMLGCAESTIRAMVQNLPESRSQRIISHQNQSRSPQEN